MYPNQVNIFLLEQQRKASLKTAVKYIELTENIRKWTLLRMVFREEHLKIAEFKKNLKFTLYFSELLLLHVVTKNAPNKINNQDISGTLT